MNRLNFYFNELETLKDKGGFREIQNLVQDGKFVILNGKKLLNLSSNDYLGISLDNSIKDNFLSQYKGKIQNPSARLLSGTNKAFAELEDFIASLLHKDKALLFNSGYHANVGIYSAILTKEDVVFVDKLNHASIIDGIRLSGAKIIPFSHTDYFDLEEKLKLYRSRYRNSIISSETLFSMDGDFADIKRLAALKEKYNSILIIDEAHSFGVFAHGAGYCAEVGALDEVDIVMGTFGKAVGSYGAFAAGNKVLIEYLINKARSFIFSTALPEISVSFSKYVMENYILKGELQEKLLELVDFSHSTLNTKGKSYIIPFILGENADAINASNKLINGGFYTLPIRYPTVKKGQARIRISLNPAVTKDEILKLKNALFE